MTTNHLIPWGPGASGPMEYDDEWILGEVALNTISYKSEGNTIGELILYYKHFNTQKAFGVDIELTKGDTENLIFALQEMMEGAEEK